MLRTPFPSDLVDAIRADVFAGYPTREIAERQDVAFDLMDTFLATRRGRWLGERRDKFRIKQDKIVLFRPRARRDGGVDIIPFSVPKISMHVAMLKEA